MSIEELVNEEITILQKKIWSRDGMPVEVIKVVEEIKNRLKDIGNEQKIDLPRTYEYVDSQFEVLENFLKTKMGESRKSQKMTDIIKEVRAINTKSSDKFRRNVIEQGEKEDKKESTQITAKILMGINDLVENIYTGQKRRLNAQGYNQNDIEKVMYDIKRMMQKYLENNSKGKIENAIMLDNVQIRELEKETLLKIDIIKQRNEKDKNEFREELKMHTPTLDEQKEDSVKRNEKEKEKAKKIISEENSLPSDVLK